MKIKVIYNEYCEEVDVSVDNDSGRVVRYFVKSVGELKTVMQKVVEDVIKKMEDAGL